MFLPVHRKPWCVLPAGLPFSFICGFPFSPSILIFGSGASDVVTLLPTLFSGVCATSPYLGLVYGAAYLVSPAFEPLSQAYFRTLPLTTLFLLALATAKMGWELQALSSMVTFVAGDDCLSYIPQLVTKSESLTRSFPRSFLVTSLADFAAGLDYDLLLCPGRALRLYLLRARSLSTGRHRLFVSPRRPARPFLRTRCRSFGEVIAAARAARPQVGSLRAHTVRSVSTSVAFHRHWSVASILDQPLGPPVRCFLNIILATFNTNLMVYFLLVTSWLRVLG